jgi:hypothetical protein
MGFEDRMKRILDRIGRIFRIYRMGFVEFLRQIFGLLESISTEFTEF